nr:unnamed protein product [Naegleria fowleri]
MSSKPGMGRTIYVSNLPEQFNEELLKTFFDECGTITNCKMAGDATNRYAFVEFATPDEAKIALELSGTDLLGKTLRISLSRNPISSPPNKPSSEQVVANASASQSEQPQETSPPLYKYLSESDLKKKAEEEEKVKRTIYVTCIDTQITETQVCEFFSYCGRIVNYRVCGDTQHPTRFGFFEFEQKESAQAAISLSGQFLGRYALRILGSRTPIQPTPGAVGNGATYSFTPVHHDQINRTVYVGNVDVGLTEDDLKEFFDANCGPVTKVVLAGDAVHSARFAFVEFLHFESRNKALECSGTLLGNRNIRINPSRTPILGGGKAYASTAPSINPATGTGQYAVNHLAQSSKFPPIAPVTDPYYNQPHFSSKKTSLISSKKKTGDSTTPLGTHHKPYTDIADSEKKRRKNDWSSSDEDSDSESREDRRQKKIQKPTTATTSNAQPEHNNNHNHDIVASVSSNSAEPFYNPSASDENHHENGEENDH